MLFNLTAAMVVILNGPSGAGKSTMQKELQKIMPQPYLKMGIDQLFDAMVPDEFTLGEKPKGFDQKTLRFVEMTTKDGHPSIPLFIGPEGQKIIKGMIGAIKAYADAGNNIVVDYIQYDTSWTPLLKKALKKHHVIWVRVMIPLETLEAREKARGTSPVGHARSHYDTVHNKINYDLEVNPGTMSAKECAKKIKAFIEKQK